MGIKLDALRQIGIGIEGTQFTGVAPTNWFYRGDPFKTNSRVNHIEKSLGIGKAHKTYGVIKGARWSEPQGTIYADALGYLPILKLIHPDVTTTGADPYTHTGLFNGDPALSATIAVDDVDKGEEKIAGFVLASIKESYRMNEIIKIELNGRAKHPESVTGQYTPAYDLDIPFFIGEFVSVKIASTFAGLAGATALEVQELDFEYDFGATEAPSQTHSLGSRDMVRNFTKRSSGKVTLKKFWADNTFRGYYEDGDVVAMSISIENPDVDLGGAVHPKITRVFPAVSVKWSEDSSADDVQMESLELTIHEGDDGSDQYTFSTTLINDDANV